MLTEKMLIEAAEELNIALLNALPDETECGHEFSAEFERKMKRLIQRTDHPFRYIVVQRAASIILVLFLSLMALLTIRPTVRAAVLGWIRENYDFYTKYTYSNSADMKSDEYYLSSLPEGYIEHYRYNTTGNTTVHYVNDETNQLINFFYSNDYNSISYYVKQEECTREDIIINGIPVDYYQSRKEGGSNAIVGSNKESTMFFIITAHEDMDEMIKIFENIKKVEK